MMDADQQSLVCIAFCSLAGASLLWWLWNGGKW